MSTVNVTQFSTEGKNMLGRAFNNFLDNIILEHATKGNDYYSLFAHDISYDDRKIFLSYLIDIDTYEDFTSNKIRERESLKEYEDEMQYFINDRIDDLYFEIQHEKSRR